MWPRHTWIDGQRFTHTDYSTRKVGFESALHRNMQVLGSIQFHGKLRCDRICILKSEPFVKDSQKHISLFANPEDWNPGEQLSICQQLPHRWNVRLTNGVDQWG